MKNVTGFLAIPVLIAVGLACSKSFVANPDVKQMNKLMEEGNNFISKANDEVKTADKKFDELEKKIEEIKSDDDLKKARDFGRELFPIYDSISGNYKKAKEKFEEAVKLKIHEKEKEYLELKAKEMQKLSDLTLERKKTPQALIDSKNKREYESDRDKINENVEKMRNEAKELNEKAAKIIKDNPNLFKKE